MENEIGAVRRSDKRVGIERVPFDQLEHGRCERVTQEPLLSRREFVVTTTS
jgi:hypothetical protein